VDRNVNGERTARDVQNKDRPGEACDHMRTAASGLVLFLLSDGLLWPGFQAWISSATAWSMKQKDRLKAVSLWPEADS
jgi:hypothetical protein